MSAEGDKKSQQPDMFITERNPEEDLLDGSSIPHYKMNYKSRGIALIINNETFQNGLPKREGSGRDADCMQDVLKTLQFTVIRVNNKTAKEMKQLFEDISRTNHAENACFLAVIMSHGEDDDVLFGTDDTVTVTELVEYILPNICPSLVGKPKLFFIQACRGTKLDKGTEKPDAMESTKTAKKKNQMKIPLWADILISYSTVPGYFSWRNSINGSWFIQSLAKVLANYGKKEELTTLLTMVNAKVAFEYESNAAGMLNKMKEMPTFSSMLTRKLYF